MDGSAGWPCGSVREPGSLTPNSGNDFYHRCTPMNTDCAVFLFASLRLCASAPLRLCASAPLRLKVIRRTGYHTPHSGCVCLRLRYNGNQRYPISRGLSSAFARTFCPNLIPGLFAVSSSMGVTIGRVREPVSLTLPILVGFVGFFDFIEKKQQTPLQSRGTRQHMFLPCASSTQNR